MKNAIDVDSVILILEKQLTDIKRIINHRTESKMDLETKIERLCASLKEESIFISVDPLNLDDF